MTEKVTFYSISKPYFWRVAQTIVQVTQPSLGNDFTVHQAKATDFATNIPETIDSTLKDWEFALLGGISVHDRIFMGESAQSILERYRAKNIDTF